VRRNAFTLLELLLAVSLTAVVMAAAGGLMSAGFAARRVVADTAGQSRTLALALDHIGRSLQSALPPHGLLAGEFVGEDAEEHENDVLRFHASIDPFGTEWSDIVQVEYRLDADSEGTLCLVRTCWRNLLATRTTEGETQVLCRGVAEFEVGYFDGADWYDAWDSTQRGNTLPIAVSLLLRLESEEEDTDGPALERLFLLPCATGQEVSS
jgi:type II secretion system protein J